MRIAAALAVCLVACGGKLASEDAVPSPRPVNEPTSEPASVAEPSPPPPSAPEPVLHPQRNDLNDPGAAKMCAEAAKADLGTFKETWSDEPARVSTAHSIAGSVGAERAVNGHYETSFAIEVAAPVNIERDPAHGLTRREAFTLSEFVLVSPVSRPDAFAIGKPEIVEWRGMSDTETYCSEDGQGGGVGGGASGDPWQGTVTLTERTDKVVSGVFEAKNTKGVYRLTFVTPIRPPADPSIEAVCCLKR